MQRKPTPRADIILAVFLIVVCAATLWESREIPPGSFEPLGSAPVPQAVAGLILGLCLIVIVKAAFQLLSPQTTDSSVEPPTLRPLDALAIMILTIVYCLIMQFRLLNFALATMLFLIATIGLLTRFRLRSLPLISAVAIIMGYGCQYLFTQVFVVDLPAVY
jgi:hypothetical protein